MQEEQIESIQFVAFLSDINNSLLIEATDPVGTGSGRVFSGSTKFGHGMRDLLPVYREFGKLSRPK